MKHIVAKKVIVFLVMLVLCTYLSSTSVYATGLDKVISDGDKFLTQRDKNSVIDEQALSNTSNTVYNILFTIAVVLAFGVGMIIGIQFIVASVDEKAKIKETLVPYIVGVFIIFSAFTVWKIAIEIGNKVSPTPEATGTTTTTTTTAHSTTYVDSLGQMHCKSCDKVLTETEKRDQRCSCGTSLFN